MMDDPAFASPTHHGEPSLRPPLRISTAPPNEWDGDPNEAGYYCDLRAIDDWRDYPLLRAISAKDRDAILRDGVFGYVVADSFVNREIGLLIHIDDREDGIVYCGVDHLGRVCMEPAANEALWSVANAGGDLAEGYRLARAEAP